MSLKTIMVHVDDDNGRTAPLEVAIRVAAAFGSRLTAVYLTPGLDMTPTVAALMPEQAVKRRMRESGEAQARAENAFRAATLAAALANIEWRAPAGRAVDAATAQGRCTDLFIIGQGEPGSAQSKFVEELLMAIVVAAGRPALVVPYVDVPNTLGENILIAWDESKEASRAVADAMPFLERARRVRVVMVNRDGNNVDEPEPVTGSTNLSAWLSAHGVDAEMAHDDVADVDIADWLLSRAADFDCDLIVMGGYGHARVREVVLGSVTRSMLHSMTVPLLLSH